MSTKQTAQVAVIMGSDSDWPVMKSCVDMLHKFGVDSEVRVLSAHRTPDATAQYASSAHERGLKVIIAAAGMAAHLAGVFAAHTILPVIGVPMAAGPLVGVDALLSTVQMPPGIPVATVGIGSAGAKNAAILAVEILALSDDQLSQKRQQYRDEIAENARQKNQDLQTRLAQEAQQ